MRHFNEKQDEEIFAAVEDNFGDALKMTSIDLEEESVKEYFYTIIPHSFKELIDDIRIGDIIKQGISSSMCTERIQTESQLKGQFVFVFKLVIYVMVEGLKRQADDIVSKVVEHVQDRIAMEANDGNELKKIRSRKMSRKPVADL